jgi:hypothetical protein
VDSIQEWEKQNKMNLNIDKTKQMIINQTTAGPTSKSFQDQQVIKQKKKWKDNNTDFLT